MLASDALRDEVAPVEPWRKAARLWSAAAALCFGLALVARVQFAEAVAWELAFDGIAAACLLLLAVLPLRYSFRAGAMWVLGGATLLAGFWGVGPTVGLASLTTPKHWAAVIAASAVAAALLFRARYRAYGGARRALAAALLFAAPFLAYLAFDIADQAATQQLTRGIILAAFAISLVGFMGPAVNVRGAALAAVLLLAVVGASGAEWILLRGQGTVAIGSPIVLGASAVSLLISGVLVSLGGFQLLARRHWPKARATALRSNGKLRGRLKSLGEFWSTRS